MPNPQCSTKEKRTTIWQERTQELLLSCAGRALTYIDDVPIRPHHDLTPFIVDIRTGQAREQGTCSSGIRPLPVVARIHVELLPALAAARERDADAAESIGRVIALIESLTARVKGRLDTAGLRRKLENK